jgi:LmbE family N-acetylglucosaminyl deacetylase
MDVIRYADPDIIITHSPDDYMPDHVATSKLVYDASFHSTLPNFKTNRAPNRIVPPIYYMDNLSGVDFAPTEYVDISGFVDTKKEMMGCHESQVVWLKEHDNMDAYELIETSAEMRGLQCGAAFAEGFTHANRWLRLGTRRLLP